jgi:hypothetical protein
MGLEKWLGVNCRRLLTHESLVCSFFVVAREWEGVSKKANGLSYCERITLIIRWKTRLPRKWVL